MTQDQLGVLEELLDSLERRGLAVTRVKFGEVELEFVPNTIVSGRLETIQAAAPVPADVEPTVPYTNRPYGVTSLWPNGVRPSFPKPPESR